MAKNSLSNGPADLKSTPEEVVVDLGSNVSQASTLPPPSIPGVCASVSDSVLPPSVEAHSQSDIIANKHVSRSQRAAGLVSDDVSAVPKGTVSYLDSHLFQLEPVNHIYVLLVMLLTHFRMSRHISTFCLVIYCAAIW